MTPWTDRAGKFSLFKTGWLVGIRLPALLLLYSAFSGTLVQSRSLGPLDARPITKAIHETGDCAIRFLFLALALTPLRRIANWPKLVVVRRMLGLSAHGRILHFADVLSARPLEKFQDRFPARSHRY
jgi:sulfoxide reductase heme-binding subunit YedZ